MSWMSTSRTEPSSIYSWHIIFKWVRVRCGGESMWDDSVLTLKHQTLNINTDCCWCPMSPYLLFIPIPSLSSHGSRDPGRTNGYSHPGAVVLWVVDTAQQFRHRLTTFPNIPRKHLLFVKCTNWEGFHTLRRIIWKHCCKQLSGFKHKDLHWWWVQFSIFANH